MLRPQGRSQSPLAKAFPCAQPLSRQQSVKALLVLIAHHPYFSFAAPFFADDTAVGGAAEAADDVPSLTARRWLPKASRPLPKCQDASGSNGSMTAWSIRIGEPWSGATPSRPSVGSALWRQEILDVDTQHLGERGKSPDRATFPAVLDFGHVALRNAGFLR